MPAPDFVNVPVLLMIPVAVASPVPPMIAAVVRVIFPDIVEAVALLFNNEPLIVKSSAVIKPFKSTMAPDAIVVTVVVPNAALFPSFKVPALTVVAALYVLAIVNVQVPAPDLVNVPVPPIIPDAVAVPVPPRIAAVVRVITPVALAVPLLLTNEPLIVNSSAVVNPFKSTIAPDEMAVAVVVPNASLLPSFKVPALTVVVPL